MPTKTWIEADAETALYLTKLAMLLDEQAVGPTKMAKIIMESLDVILTGIERIGHLTAMEPVVSRSPLFHYFDRERISEAMEVLQDLWLEVGESQLAPRNGNDQTRLEQFLGQNTGATHADFQKSE